MPKRFTLILIALLIISLLGSSVVWAKPSFKNKDFLPPGLAKKAAKGEMLPPPFQNMYKFNNNITGKIVYKQEIAGQNWIVVAGEDCLKALKLNGKAEFTVGNIVNVNYDHFNNVVDVKLIDGWEEVTESKLNYVLTVNPKQIVLGDEVDFNLTIENRSDYEITKHFTSGQRYDFIVKKDGKKVWQWSDGIDFISVIQNIVFEPEDKETYSIDWEPEKTGKYTVEAYFMGESRTQPVATKEFWVLDNEEELKLSYKLDVIKGDPNLFILKVTNKSDETINITLPTGQIYDFLVTEDGDKVWQWSDGRSFSQASQNLKFYARETKLYYAQFKPEDDGDYQVYGFFKGAENKVIGPRSFSID